MVLIRVHVVAERLPKPETKYHRPIRKISEYGRCEMEILRKEKDALCLLRPRPHDSGLFRALARVCARKGRGRTYDETGEGAAVGAEELGAHGGGALGRDAEFGLEELVDVAPQGRAEAGVARVQGVVEVCSGERHSQSESECYITGFLSLVSGRGIRRVWSDRRRTQARHASRSSLLNSTLQLT